MALKVTQVDTWAATIPDVPGGLAGKLEALAAAGADLEFVVARRTPDKPGQGVVFVTPIRGARQEKAAKAAGFSRAVTMHSGRAEGPNRPGAGAKILRALAEQGINLRGLSAAAVGRKFVAYAAFDSEADAARASRILKKL